MASCKCGRKWSGLNQAHCASGCHEHFSTVSHFDKHRATGHCQHPAAIRDRNGEPVLRASDGPFGITWVSAKERPEHLKREAS
ncbi:MAG: hypothetical protein JWO67_2228 [Streptosporangiaceae bacterium]|nr:hypothetical protein [Streptosporangiaceae bacterium]